MERLELHLAQIAPKNVRLREDPDHSIVMIGHGDAPDSPGTHGFAGLIKQ